MRETGRVLWSGEHPATVAWRCGTAPAERRRGVAAVPGDRRTGPEGRTARSAAVAPVGPRPVRSNRRREARGLTVLFDRSFVEALAHGALTHAMQQALAARRLADPVLVCPPWPELLHDDAERRTDPARMAREFAAETQAYRALGHRLVEVPRAPVVARVGFVRAVLEGHATVC